MPYMISKVDITLDIPPKMRGIFPNEKRLLIPLKAGEPTPVPDYVLKYYTKNRPRVYRDAKLPEPAAAIQESPKPQKQKFDPVEFLEQNYNRIEEALKSLEDRRDILAVGKTLGLKNIHTQKSERVIERIIHDVEVKNRSQEELQKHKGAD